MTTTHFPMQPRTLKSRLRSLLWTIQFLIPVLIAVIATNPIVQSWLSLSRQGGVELIAGALVVLFSAVLGWQVYMKRRAHRRGWHPLEFKPSTVWRDSDIAGLSEGYSAPVNAATQLYEGNFFLPAIYLVGHLPNRIWRRLPLAEHAILAPSLAAPTSGESFMRTMVLLWVLDATWSPEAHRKASFATAARMNALARIFGFEEEPN